MTIPVDVFTVIQSELLQSQGSRQDATSGGAAYEVKQLMNTFAAASLQFPQHAQGSKTLHAPPVHAQDAYPPALYRGSPYSLTHFIVLAYNAELRALMTDEWL